jgi:hypothetical protein
VCHLPPKLPPASHRLGYRPRAHGRPVGARSLFFTGSVSLIGEHELARGAYLRTVPRSGNWGFYELAVHAMRADTPGALATLREIARGGARCQWRYYRDFDPNLASIRNEPEFKAVFADIERDMAQQRARLAARPKDAPLNLAGNQ